MFALPCALNPSQPSVTICTPTDGSTVTSPVRIAAGANSSPTASLIQIYIDGSKAYQIAGSELDTSLSLSPGTHRVTVQAYNGSWFKQTIYVTVSSSSTSSPCTLDPTQPSVTICTPANNATVSSPVHVVAGSNSSPAASGMKIYVDGTAAYNVSGTSIDTNLPLTAGTHRITVQAYNGNYFWKTIYVTVSSGSSSSPCTLNSTQPSVTICSPQDKATVTSPVHVVAGSNSSPVASRMKIYVDGTEAYRVAASSIDTNLTLTGGTHRLTVQAYNGNYFWQTIYVTVSSSTSAVSVSVSPATATILEGAEQQFTAKVQNTTNTQVTWSVDGIAGGNSTVGTVSSSGLYTAPMSTGTHTIKATSAADTSAGGTASVTVQATNDSKCVANSAQPSVTICVPAPNSTVTSPVHVVAQSNSSPAASYLQIYLDGKWVKTVQGASMDTSFDSGTGSHRLTVQAYNGTYFKSSEDISVTTATVGVSVSISPTSATLDPGGTQQFTATVKNASNTAVTWSVDGTAGGSSSAGTISSTGLYTAPSTNGNHTVTATSQADPSQSASAAVTVGTTTAPPPSNYSGQFTYKNNNARQGANLQETILKPSNVNSSTFGKRFSYSVDGNVYAQPLYVPNLSIGGTTRNVLYVATENDSVYAFDADGKTLSPLWKRSFIDPANGITTVPQSDVGSTIYSVIGITGTPVIDPATKTLYVVALTKETSGTTVKYVQRLHALSITTGAERSGSPVVISGSVAGVGDGTVNGEVAFNAKIQLQRPALLLKNGVVYIAWASHGDHGTYHGWVMGYDASSLQRVMIFNVSPNGRRGGIWQSGGGLVADDQGYIYFMTGNGTFNADQGGTEYGDSFVKIDPNGNVVDWFTPFDQDYDNAHDVDLGVGGPLLLPDQPGSHPHLITGAGKDHRIYLLDRDNMGHFQSGSDSQIVQELPNILLDHCHEQPAYWNGYVYYSAENDVMHQLKLSNGLLSQVATTTTVFAGGDNVGTNPSLSANGNTDGIVWTTERTSSATAVLHAYDATNIHVELYNSNQAGTRDTLGAHQKYTPPTVANGRVYVALNGKIAVFGLLN